MYSLKLEIGLIITSQISVYDEHLKRSHGHYEHFHKSIFMQMYAKIYKMMNPQTSTISKQVTVSLEILEIPRIALQ